MPASIPNTAPLRAGEQPAIPIRRRLSAKSAYCFGQGELPTPVFSLYSYNVAKADTNGVTYTPSVAQNPGLDYGRSSFDVHNRFVILGNFSVPYGIALTPFFAYNSGAPYNVTTGSDLTRNNQFNARPTFSASANCAIPVLPGEQRVYYSTPYGCLNTNPFGTNEKIIPYGIGTGPTNVSLNMRVSKVIGIGPKVEGGRVARGGGGGGGGGGRGGGGGIGPGGLSGSRGGPGRLDRRPHAATT